jgi:formylglycine-generating enzyme required for sulfatase activity
MVSADGTIIGVSAGTATITVTTADGGKTAFCTVTIVNDGTPVAVLTGSRYQADPYTGTDKIKYSYRYNGYDFYYIYLGQLRNIPLFYGNNYQHTWDTTSYTYKFSKTNSTTISNTVTKSSQEVVSISNEHTASTTSEYKFHEEINANFKVFGIGTEIKVSADQNFKNYASNTSTFQQTTSLTNTVTYGTSQTESTQESASITLTRADKPGWYRYTFFSASDVYLYVVRDPAKPDEIYYEFRENVIPGLNFWKMDYSPTPDFNKNDATRFGVDISMLKNLPTPELKFITIPMVYVPGGSFQMGKELGTTGSGDFSPVHPVTLNGFYMGKYQVTQAQYEAVMGSNPSYFSSNPASGEVQGNRPVENVSWYDAIVFCNKLSMAEGLNPAYSISGNTNPSDWGIVPTSSNSTWNSAVIVAGSNGYRLPTEAQWEYAAKGGNGTPGNYTYAGSNNIDEVAWYIDNSNSMTHEVGKKPPNGLGLYDMSGNVWEWCWDWYGYYSNEAQTDPQGSTAGDFRVLRGGCCLYVNHNDASSVHRGIYPPSGRTSPHGFRLVRP